MCVCVCVCVCVYVCVCVCVCVVRICLDLWCCESKHDGYVKGVRVHSRTHNNPSPTRVARSCPKSATNDERRVIMLHKSAPTASSNTRFTFLRPAVKPRGMANNVKITVNAGPANT